jgi:molybdopterin molybdotransferase/putative molybdopterin biosynthesis protein
VPVRIPSELGHEEFVLVSLVGADDGLIAFPTGKGSGAVTAFSQADGFLPSMRSPLRSMLTAKLKSR